MSDRPFKRIVLKVYCAACRLEMYAETWPSHYRTRDHRANRERLPIKGAALLARHDILRESRHDK